MSIQRFRAGEAVPDYILDIEPLTPGGPRPPIYFSGDTDVIDTGDRFVLMSVKAGNNGTVTVRGGAPDEHHRIFAATKAVLLPMRWQELGYDGGEWEPDETSPSPIRPLVSA